MPEPDLSIIVVNWNTRELLAQCLRSLYLPSQSQGQESLQKPCSCEVFVVDNASSDGSAEVVSQRFPQVHLVQNKENVGFARANNQVIPPSRGHYVMLLNSDTEVQPGALETLLAFMDSHPKVGATGPRLLNTDGSLQPSCHPMLTPGREFWRLLFLERISPRATYPMHRWDDRAPRQVEVIKGACLLLRREALNLVGLLDESYFMYTEEVDLCYRLAQAGWQCWWVPEAKVIHHGEASSRQVAQRMYLALYRSKIQFYRKYGGEPRANRFKGLLRLAYGPRLLVATMGAPFSSSLSARARTYRQLLAELPEM
ncbi:MAG: glycosyltransferase family 2 protein [Anaerolineae bacterium]|nr:glycosyltransferase family 2 protein [Anaerolineae bacterium]